MDHERGDQPDGVPAPALERLARRRREPWTLAGPIAAFLAVVSLALWGRIASGPSAATAGPTAEVDSSAVPVATAKASMRSLPTSASDLPSGTALYRSITDNEWTIVALLTPGPAPSTEEPAQQHAQEPALSLDGPFAVLQQGLSPVDPADRPGGPEQPCLASVGPRDRDAVHLPRGRVVFLGFTLPGLDAGARVEATALGPPRVRLARATAVDVQLSGMQPGWRYTIPSTGPGGTILYTASPATLLPSAAYRFRLEIPGIDGARDLYACVDP